MFRERLIEIVNAKWPGHLWDVQAPPDPKMGDYSVNLAFALAKTEHRPVLDVARDIVGFIHENEELSVSVAKTDVIAPGFVNIYLAPSYLQEELRRIGQIPETYGHSDEGAGKKIIVEYSAPNIAKLMHVGHLRSTIIGDALANVYETLGYEVVRWNYIGDWGTNFGKLIAAYKQWGNEEVFTDENPVKAMEELYVRFNAEAADNPVLQARGREEFKKLENGDTENRTLWERFRALSLKAFTGMYERLDVGLTGADVINKGESDYEEQLPALITTLQEGGLAHEGEQGALIIDLSEYGIATPGMLRKSDGATLYLTRDIASLQDRMALEPSAILYVVANQQALHLEQLFAVAEAMKHKGLLHQQVLPSLIHVKYGLVLGPDGKKFSTRQGNAVPLEDVLDEAERRAAEVVREKNPQLEVGHVADIAHIVALSALKYNDLRQHPHSDISFDWDAMLDLTGNSGPYVQYTHARLMSILAKAGHRGTGDTTTLTESDELLLMRRLLDFPHAVAECAKASALSGLALYLYELAALANRYYEHTRILEDENVPRMEARLTLVATVAAVLRRGLGLLGIRAPERI